ncbi:hypothetical protein CMO95_01755 [Candidatus Woesearchaeota archaeon]|nr:hypothetical protein [Candidatus Woesearchaeota archaeon]
MAVEVTIKESFHPENIVCNVSGNENKKINQPVIVYYKTSESQTDEEARIALQTMIENNEDPI